MRRDHNLLFVLVCAHFLLGVPSLAQECPAPTHPAGNPRHCVIAEAPGRYCAWPSVVRAMNGDLLVMFTESEEHLGPDGRILGVRSTDNGESWQPPFVIYDTPIDDRESGITTLADGTIIAHVWSTFHTRSGYAALPSLSYERSILERWSSFVDAPRYKAHAGTQGAWTLVSRDYGHTWSKPLQGCDAVHGGIELRDGSLLVASYRRNTPRIGVYSSSMPELECTLTASIGSPAADSVVFGEPHILQLSSGRIVMMIRATALRYDDTSPRCVLWETYSDDNGTSWAVPFRTPLWGFPPQLLQLADGRVLCSYGYRKSPFGQRACISDDGLTWELKNEIVVRDDAPNGDLGYPASVQLESSRILTVYYQANVPAGTVQRMHPPDPTRMKPGIMGTVWTIPPRRPGK